MANEMLEAAKREVELLRAALARNADYQKLQHVQKLIAIYETYEPGQIAGGEVKSPEHQASATPVAAPRPGSKVAQVDDVVSKYLADRGARASSGEILPVIIQAGVEMGGSIPSKTLSSFLSNSKRFNNVKGLGYGLTEWGETAGPKAAENLKERLKMPWDLLGESEAPSGDSK